MHFQEQVIYEKGLFCLKNNPHWNEQVILGLIKYCLYKVLEKEFYQWFESLSERETRIWCLYEEPVKISRGYSMNLIIYEEDQITVRKTFNTTAKEY